MQNQRQKEATYHMGHVDLQSTVVLRGTERSASEHHLSLQTIGYPPKIEKSGTRQLSWVGVTLKDDRATKDKNLPI